MSRRSRRGANFAGGLKDWIIERTRRGRAERVCLLRCSADADSRGWWASSVLQVRMAERMSLREGMYHGHGGWR